MKTNVLPSESTINLLSQVSCAKRSITRASLDELLRGRHRDFSDFYLPNASGVAFDDESVGRLVALSGLEIVGLENSQISDAAVLSLAKLSSLKLLDLDNTDVTDVGIAALTGHPNLEILWLEDTRVTLKSINNLAYCPKLRYLSVIDTDITSSDASRLRDAGVVVVTSE